MTLTKLQVDELFAFTEKKFVRFYDLQVELVDHLAARIEEEIEATPGLTFESALKKVYAEFGIFGFAHVVQEKTKQVEKSNNRIWIKEIVAFFTFPKIISVIFLATIVYQLATVLQPGYICLLMLAAWTVYNIYSFFSLNKERKKKVKNLMLLQFNPYKNFTWIPIYHYFVFSRFYSFNSLDYINPFWFTVIIVGVLILQMSHTEVYKKIRAKALELYPEAFALG